jgi:hypothetical protein
LLLLSTSLHRARSRAGVKFPPSARPVFGSKKVDNSERNRDWSRRNRLRAALPSCAVLFAPVQPPDEAAWTGFTPLQRRRTRWCVGFAARCWGSHAGDEGGSGLPSCVSPGEYASALWLGQGSVVWFRPFGAPFRCPEVLGDVWREVFVRNTSRVARPFCARDHRHLRFVGVSRRTRGAEFGSTGLESTEPGRACLSSGCADFLACWPSEFR